MNTSKNLNIASYIDHTLLKPEASQVQIEKLCQEAMENHFFAVCVNSYWVSLCKKILSNSQVKVCSVIGFPLGAMSTEAKSFETSYCIDAGADEIDMVLNIGLIKSKELILAEQDIKMVVNAAQGKTVKVILETCLLNHEEKIHACKMSLSAGAHFVKTSTGFSTSGANLEDIKLMRETVGSQMKLKASGGIKNLSQAQAYIDAGVSRLGTSSGIEILNGLTASSNY